MEESAKKEMNRYVDDRYAKLALYHMSYAPSERPTTFYVVFCMLGDVFRNTWRRWVSIPLPQTDFATW